MLKQRVITAIILTIVFLAALFGLSPVYFPLFVGAVVLIGARNGQIYPVAVQFGSVCFTLDLLAPSYLPFVGRLGCALLQTKG